MQNPFLRIRPLFRRWVAWCWATILLPLGLPAAEAPLLATPASPTVPPPLSLAYAPTSGKAGFAAGEVILRCGEPLPDSFLLHWGDAEGKLPGHAPFAPVACTGETTQCRIADCIALPSGATRLLAWSVKGGQTSESAAEAPVPASARREWEKTGTAYEMQVVSDTHVRTDRNHLFTRHFQKALQDIAAVSPDSIGVFVVGDLTDNGTDAEYETYLSMVRAFDSRLPGHSHWELNSPNTMFSGAADFPVCFNTASVGYTWNDGSQKTGIGVNGSEGYYLEAKEDGLLLVRGRDFENGLWLPSAQFIVEPAGRRQRGGGARIPFTFPASFMMTRFARRS